ncbi:putative mitochondrial protein [Cardamine amara subsp. amara]|uniref:Mitochondrial protein n=1 Tax=Cardamine amara subsp. amara TaxID=228776 RepID=A0ABD1AU03_CARAN
MAVKTDMSKAYDSEVLSGLCRNAQLDVSLQGLRVANKSPRVNHLLFADDTMFFCRTNPRSIETLKRIAKEYEEASEQCINKEKSAVTFSKRLPMI